MAANGRVCTGFSKPYVARYVNTAGVISYTDCMPLARGVSVTINPETGSDNAFYADNVEAENSPGIFNGGTVELTVDGLLTAAERFIWGLPEAEEVNGVSVVAYGDDSNPPYMGIGFLARYMSEGVTTWVPYILRKTMFQVGNTEAATQEQEIDWQTQTLTANLMRDDSANHRWKMVGAETYSTEAAAEAALVALLGGTASSSSSESTTTG